MGATGWNTNPHFQTLIGLSSPQALPPPTLQQPFPTAWAPTPNATTASLSCPEGPGILTRAEDCHAGARLIVLPNHARNPDGTSKELCANHPRVRRRSVGDALHPGSLIPGCRDGITCRQMISGASSSRSNKRGIKVRKNH